MQTHATQIPNALLRIEAARALTGDSRGGFYGKVTAGLMTRPIKIGARSSAVPAREIERINAARIAGATDDELRALVSRLHVERTAVAVE